MTATPVVLVFVLLAGFALSAKTEKGENRPNDSSSKGLSRIIAGAKGKLGATKEKKPVCSVAKSSTGAGLCCRNMKCDVRSGKTYACLRKNGVQTITCASSSASTKKLQRQWKSSCRSPRTLTCQMVDHDFICNCSKRSKNKNKTPKQPNNATSTNEIPE
uniref:Evasin n=1 Tax=Rhipicephalus zambeziensis TaxID=60191 RepID=A0A224YLP4_9ACAR